MIHSLNYSSHVSSFLLNVNYRTASSIASFRLSHKLTLACGSGSLKIDFIVAARTYYQLSSSRACHQLGGK